MMNFRDVILLFTGLIFLFLFACKTTSLVDTAVKKQGAARYAFEHNDYINAKKYCLEAIDLWVTIKNEKNRSKPNWAIDNSIENCNNLLSLIPVSNSIDAPVIIPITIENNKILVNVIINQSSTATLLLDTGATRSLLTPEFVKTLGLYPPKKLTEYTVKLIGEQQVKMPFIHLKEIRIDRAVVNNLHVGMYPAFPDQPNIHGILGSDFLMYYTVTINHKSNTLSLSP